MGRGISQIVKKKAFWIISGLVLVAILAVVIPVSVRQKKYYNITNEESFSQWHDRIIYKGSKYHRNKDISPILFLGVDHADGLEDAIYMGRSGRSDTIYIFLLNKKDKTVTLLSMSRDTMTEVDVYNPEGEYYFSGVMQVTMQYAYGKNAKNSCKLAEQTISEVLFHLDFDAYIAVNLEAITKVVDMLGGLTITMPEDYSYIDPRYIAGAELTLNSWEVEWLLRYRDLTQLESNDIRMKRQALLIETVADELKSRGISSSISDILKIAKEDITTNAGLGTIKKIATYQLSEDIYKVPGETRAGSIHAEYYVDNNALMDLLVELLYVQDK